MEFIEESMKGRMTLAYFIGAMHHTDPKKYPKRPDQLWDTRSEEMSIEQLKILAIAWASNGAEVLREEMS